MDPVKINLGVASFGRTYKLCNASCGLPGCECTGPGEEGACTTTPGMLSNLEIQDLISEKGYVDISSTERRDGQNADAEIL